MTVESIYDFSVTSTEELQKLLDKVDSQVFFEELQKYIKLKRLTSNQYALVSYIIQKTIK